MSSIPPLGREAIEHARRGEFDRAIAAARRAVEAHPADLGLRVFLGMLHARRTELGEARTQFRAAVEINPADPFPRCELARVLVGLGELDEAEAVLDERNLPGPEPLRIRALILQRRGDAAAAATIYRRQVDSDPRDFESWGNLGVCLMAADRPQEAIAALERSLALRPDRASYWTKWAEAHVAVGSGEQALAQAHERAAQNPADALAMLTIARLENLLGRPEQALAAAQEAVRRDGSNPDALVALAELLERQNSLDAFEQALSQLAGLPQQPDQLPLLEARLDYRRGNTRRALELARAAPQAADAGGRAQIIGQSLDKLGDAPGAFDAFVQMNRIDAQAGAAVEGKPERYRASVADQRRLLTPEWVSSWRPADAPSEPEPAFLVGFPRSGTTLLDTLLMGHPDVAVAEEKPMLPAVGDALGGLGRLAELDTQQVEELRRLYWRVAEEHVPDARARLLVDKYPFGIGAAPIIHRLFPTARMIFMERHPCDVVLSCFMTRFQPTDWATNFLDLEDTARLYDEMMAMWARSREFLRLDVHEVRYERLVEDAEAELRSLTAFIGLEWLPQLLDHRTTAKKREFINTPSYAQVVEPVNASAVRRWERYREQMGPVLPILEPWARRMGYAI